jgi:hypothetical protein
MKDDRIWTGELNDAYEIGGRVGLYDTTLRDGEQTVGVVLDPDQKVETRASSTGSASSGSKPVSRASRKTTGTPSRASRPQASRPRCGASRVPCPPTSRRSSS